MDNGTASRQLSGALLFPCSHHDSTGTSLDIPEPPIARRTTYLTCCQVLDSRAVMGLVKSPRGMSCCGLVAIDSRAVMGLLRACGVSCCGLVTTLTLRPSTIAVAASLSVEVNEPRSKAVTRLDILRRSAIYGSFPPPFTLTRGQYVSFFELSLSVFLSKRRVEMVIDLFYHVGHS